MTDYSYTPKGVCSKQISFTLSGGKIHNLKFVGGCAGNLSAISKLLEGADARKTAALLKGNLCKDKKTSCADQLATALDNVLKNSPSAS